MSPFDSAARLYRNYGKKITMKRVMVMTELEKVDRAASEADLYRRTVPDWQEIDPLNSRASYRLWVHNPPKHRVIQKCCVCQCPDNRRCCEYAADR